MLVQEEYNILVSHGLNWSMLENVPGVVFQVLLVGIVGLYGFSEGFNVAALFCRPSFGSKGSFCFTLVPIDLVCGLAGGGLGSGSTCFGPTSCGVCCT